MDRGYYSELSRKNESLTRLSGSEKQLVSDITYRSFKLIKNVECLPLKDGIKWSYGYSNYINNQGRQSLTKVQKQKYQRGQILYVDFFGGFSEELTYDHNAVVLNTDSKGLVVAPITSSTRYYEDSKDALLIKLPKRVKNKGNLVYNSTIRLDQVRYISRTRVIRRHGLINDITVLEEISQKLAKYLSPTYTQNLIAEINSLKKEASDNKLIEQELIKKIKYLEEKNKELKILLSS